MTVRPRPCAGVAAVLAAIAAPALAQPARECASGPDFDVTISGFRAPTGYLKVYLYGDDPADFLEHARWLGQIELPVRSTAPVRLCLPVPRPGRYAVSVRHDVDGNRQRFDWSDGAGFSNNPRLSIVDPRPALTRVLVPAGEAPSPVDIVLNYRFGLRVRPVRQTEP